MSSEHPVIESLRGTLRKSRTPAAFVSELEGRIRQLLANMVDGRVLPDAEADAIRTGMLELVRTDALPAISQRDPNEALGLLDKLEAYGLHQLASERAPIEAARAARFPPPSPPGWVELEALRSAEALHPDAVSLRPGASNVCFTEALEADRVRLPEEIVALYAAFDGFDLASAVDARIPVFSLLGSAAIDIADRERGYPKRAVVFEGGDQVHISVFEDRRQSWWFGFEYDYEPTAKRPLDIPALLRFGLARMNAPTLEALDEELSWDRFFGEEET